MAKVSIIVPSCNEIAVTNEGINVVQKTVREIYEKATGEFEVIVGFNGPEYQKFPNFPNLKVINLPVNVGIKTLINVLAITASGKYIYKTDAHCSFGKGFDEILQADMQDNWLVTPRFYVLTGATWKKQQRDGKDELYDYFFLSCPFTDKRGFRFKAGGHWPQLTAERLNDSKYDLDETPQFHGSGWFVEKDFFLNKIGGFPTLDPLGHAQEPPNLGLKYWLGPWDGKVMVNKKTWYAHMHQDGRDKGYRYTREQERVSYDVWANYWMSDKWLERVHDIDWFIEKFMPMPGWPDNWRDFLENYRKEKGIK